MPFKILRQDITKLKVDAVVNAANTGLRRGGGVCGAIFKAAGGEKLQAACDKLAPIKTGEAVITPGFNLAAKYIIHAAGPIYDEWSAKESEQLLRSAYLESLRLAVDNNLESIAFPLISSGIYGYPKAEALQVATSAIEDFLKDHELEVILAVYDKSAFTISKELLGEVESYIDQHYVDSHRSAMRRSLEKEDILIQEAYMGKPALSLDQWVGNLDEPFSEMLLRLIDAKGMTDVEVYKRANLDRKLFSKIRSHKNYMPSKKTAIALAIGMQLSLEETEDLLGRAGFALSNAVIFDVIVEYFITTKQYNIFEINEVLFKYDQPILG